MEIKVEKQNVNDLFDKFWFLVPSYQRPYVWGKDNVTELLDDLWFAFENNPKEEYFLGSLVLQQTAQQTFKEYSILDGQQRLTSFLIMNAVLRDSEPQLESDFRQRIYQQKNPIKNTSERKRMVYEIRENLTLFVDKFIIADAGTKSSEIKKEIQNKDSSIAHMANAIEVMKDFFSDPTRATRLYDFGVYISNYPVFICVSTGNRDDAFRLFSILNARGVPLSSADILKSMNIGEISNVDKERYAKKWEQIESDHNNDFDRFLSIIRIILVKEKARTGLLNEFEEIYKKTPATLVKGKATVDFLDRLNNHYQKIIELSDTGLDNSYKNLIAIMMTAIPSDDWIAPLLAFYDKFGQQDLFKFLEKLEFKFTSDWILGNTPTQRIKNMCDILKDIEKFNNSNDVLSQDSLNKIDDINELRNRLSGAIYGKAFAKFVLLKYEYLTMAQNVSISNYKFVSIEHVLPQNPKEKSEWTSIFNNDERNLWTNRLANLVLIDSKKNSSLSNLDFQDKKSRYLEGKMGIFPSSQIFLKHQEWNVDVLEQRQNEMLAKLVP